MALEHLLTQSEGKTLEFKRDLSSTDNILKTLVAFTNTSGGVLLIGIENQTKAIQGVKVVNWKNVSVIKVEVYPSSLLPHYLRKMGSEKGVFIRLGSINRVAGPVIAQELKRTVEGIAFDERPMPDYGSELIDAQVASRLFDGKRKLGKNELKTLRVLTEYQRKLVPTVGGMLLFGKTKDEVFSDAFIQCARFQGVNKAAKMIDQCEIHGFLPLMVDKVTDF